MRYFEESIEIARADRSPDFFNTIGGERTLDLKDEPHRATSFARKAVGVFVGEHIRKPLAQLF